MYRRIGGAPKTYEKPEDVYVKEDAEIVSITADARDEWEMDRVEFYLDGNKIGESTVAPYSVRAPSTPCTRRAAP